VLLALATAANAVRPFTTEDGGVAGHRTFTAEFSFDYVETGNGTHEFMWMLVPGFGITWCVELSLEIPLQHADNHYGLGDICLAAKYLVCNQNHRLPMFALKAVVKTASGDAGRGLGSGAPDYSMIAAASYETPLWVTHVSLGATITGDNATEPMRDVWFGGLAGDVVITDGLHAVSELNVLRNPEIDATSDDYSLLVGLVADHSSRIIWDGGLRLGLSDAAAPWGLTLGCSLALP
jgi:hypothetical protein